MLVKEPVAVSRDLNNANKVIISLIARYKEYNANSVSINAEVREQFHNSAVIASLERTSGAI